MIPLECTKSDNKIINHYYNEIRKYPKLSNEEEHITTLRIRKGDKKALDILVKANLRFVVSVSLNYMNQGVPVIDLINEGNLGLIQAAYRFDEKKNFKFISYAVWWIRQQILLALANQSRIYKVPSHRAAHIYAVGKSQDSLEQKFHREPTIKELAHESHISENQVSVALQVLQHNRSLEKPVTTSSNSPLAFYIKNPKSEQPDDSITKESNYNAVMDMMSCLKPRERDIIHLYYGIGEDDRMTMDEIGKKYHITRERVRQIKSKALGNLRKNSTRKLFNDIIWS